MYTLILIVAAVLCVVLSQPLNKPIESIEDNTFHDLSNRYTDPFVTKRGFLNDVFTLTRSKRSSEEECEKLRLCRLHSRSNRNFFAAFELYFVNRENARLWDHHARSLAECNQRYSCYR